MSRIQQIKFIISGDEHHLCGASLHKTKIGLAGKHSIVQSIDSACSMFNASMD